jgi:dTMP kinase
MFIVLEGLDGAGKSTQIKRLTRFFEEQGRECAYLHFPRFDAPVYGELIARFLRGEFGSASEVDPYLVALIYAGDRADAASMIRRWLDEGKVVILDRYVYSNVGYQCAKIADADERRKLRDWIFKTEYEEFKIPRPDISLFLDVPFSFTERKLSEQRSGDDRDYLQGRRDIHEASLDLQRSVREVYLESALQREDITVVDCSDECGMMASADTIFERIMEHLRPLVG